MDVCHTVNGSNCKSLGILDLPWDIFVANILPQPNLSFFDCFNVLKAIHRNIRTEENFVHFVSCTAMSAFWQRKFKSLYPILYTGISQSAATNWFIRTKSRAEEAEEVQKALIAYRRKKLYHLLEQHEVRQTEFICRWLVSDPTDIRFPSYSNHRFGRESNRRSLPTFVVNGPSSTSTGKVTCYGFEIWQAHDISGTPVRDEQWLAKIWECYFGKPRRPQFQTAEFADSHKDAFDEICDIFRLNHPLSPSAGELLVIFQNAPEFDGSIPNLVAPWKAVTLDIINSVPTDKLAIHQRKGSGHQFTDVLPIGSVVRFETQSLIGTGETLSKAGVIIGWTMSRADSQNKRTATYHVIPVPCEVTGALSEMNPDRYYVTSHRVLPISNMTWMSDIPDETVKILQSDLFRSYYHPYFDQFDGKRFFVLSPDLAAMYPDEQAAQHELNCLLN